MASTTSRRLWRGLQALALALCALSLGPAAASAAGPPLPTPIPPGDIKSFTASNRSVPLGASVTLTATATFDVGPTAYWIEIFDLTTGGQVAACWKGATCSVSVAQINPTFQRYQAYVAYPVTSQPPLGVAGTTIGGTSYEVHVSWSAIAVSLSAGSMLTAVAAQDVTYTPYYILIYDLGTGALLAHCGRGSTCTATIPPSFDTFQAFVASWSSTVPTSYQGASDYVWA